MTCATATGYAAFMTEVERWLGLERVKVWHLNDSKGKLGSHVDRHTHIGEGEIGLEGFRLILNDPRWDGIAMLLETPKRRDAGRGRNEPGAALCAGGGPGALAAWVG